MNGVDPLPLYQYISGLAWLFVVFIYAPFLLLLSFYLGRRLPFSRGWKISAATLFFLVLLVLPFADVIVVGRQHQALCRKDAGTHIYRTVEVEGYFSGPSLHKGALDRGFSYVEGERKTVLVRANKSGDAIVYQKIDKPTSRYEYGDEREVITPRLGRQYHFIRDRQSGEVLGEAINYGYYWGWADRYIFVGWMGSLPPIRCGLPLGYYTPIYDQVLLPGRKTKRRTE